jgi:hypothetical protein
MKYQGLKKLLEKGERFEHTLAIESTVALLSLAFACTIKVLKHKKSA